MKTENERERTRWRGEERERLKETEGFCFFAPVIPDEIDSLPPEISHCPLSPPRPASITYLSRGWMIYTLPMSTSDRYTHQWLPVLRDLADTLKKKGETERDRHEEGWQGNDRAKTHKADNESQKDWVGNHQWDRGEKEWRGDLVNRWRHAGEGSSRWRG